MNQQGTLDEVAMIGVEDEVFEAITSIGPATGEPYAVPTNDRDKTDGVILKARHLCTPEEWVEGLRMLHMGWTPAVERRLRMAGN